MTNYKILAIGASSSRYSINKQLATFTANQVENATVTVLDLNDFEMPIYSIDRERESGIPEAALRFKRNIQEADGVVISFAEHNGSYTTAFKNIYDWVSRIEKKIWSNKPLFLLATSPGGRGGKTILDFALRRFQQQKELVAAHFSLPQFRNTFSQEEGITDEELAKTFSEQLLTFQKIIEMPVEQSLSLIQDL